MIYFLFYLFLEVITTSAFSDHFGGLWLFIEILLSGVAGIVILKNFQYSLMDSLSRVYRGEMTQQELVSSSIFSVLGAILIIVPGIFSDSLGIVMQFEFFALLLTRPFIKTKTFHSHTSSYEKPQDEIIDVEVIEK